MAIVRETLVYEGPGGPFEGLAAYDDEIETRRPGVLIVPNVLGQKEADNLKAEALAKLGYVGLACDVFGQGKRKQWGAPDQSEYIEQLFGNRALLRDRLAASLKALVGMSRVDPAKTAAIGFCFGGLSVLDMARSGQDVLGVVSFHGVYRRPDYANVDPVKAKVLVCHGWEDPLAPPDAVVGLAQELTEAKADWQLHAYGHAGHGFTDAERVGAAARPGIHYDEPADRRSWEAMRDFLAELFV